MQLQVGDLCEYQGGWSGEWSNMLCIYRGKSFSPNFYWFDFFLHSPSREYVHNGFHVDRVENSLATGQLKVIMHLPNVAPVSWRSNDHGVFFKDEK